MSGHQRAIDANRRFAGRVAADAGVDHTVGASLARDSLLKQGRVGLVRSKAWTRGQAVPKRHDDRRARAGSGGRVVIASDCCTRDEQRDGNPAHARAFAKVMPFDRLRARWYIRCSPSKRCDCENWP